MLNFRRVDDGVPIPPPGWEDVSDNSEEDVHAGYLERSPLSEPHREPVSPESAERKASPSFMSPGECSTGEDPLANINELFRCFICLGRLEDAQLCPFCSKMMCMACIERWLKDQRGRGQCPHCRRPLCHQQLVPCRFVAELASEVERLQKTPEPAPTPLGGTCPTHDCELTYFCTTCQCAVCSDCCIFGTAHGGHQFEKLGARYNRSVESVQGEAARLKKRLQHLHLLGLELESNIDLVTKAKEERVAEIELAMESMQARLEVQLKGKLLALMTQKEALSQEAVLVERTLHGAETELSRAAHSEMIDRAPALVKAMQDLQARRDFTPVAVDCDFASEVVPSYDSAVFDLHSFEAQLHPAAAAAAPEAEGGAGAAEAAEVVYSEPLSAAGNKWRLKVYPNGNGAARGKYLSVFLEMLEGGAGPTKYEYRVEMVHRGNGNQRVLREFASEFEPGECWGYNRFFRIDLLVKEGYLAPQEDVLSLRFAVRAPTYAQQACDMRRLIDGLRREGADKDRQAAALKRALVDALSSGHHRGSPGSRVAVGPAAAGRGARGASTPAASSASNPSASTPPAAAAAAAATGSPARLREAAAAVAEAAAATDALGGGGEGAAVVGGPGPSSVAAAAAGSDSDGEDARSCRSDDMCPVQLPSSAPSPEQGPSRQPSPGQSPQGSASGPRPAAAPGGAEVARPASQGGASGAGELEVRWAAIVGAGAAEGVDAEAAEDGEGVVGGGAPVVAHAPEALLRALAGAAGPGGDPPPPRI